MCGPHCVTRPLARRACQLATVEHCTHLPQLVFDQHGVREADEVIFAADGGDWCGNIPERSFPTATGIVDWYHVSEHVWTCGKALHADAQAVKA